MLNTQPAPATKPKRYSRRRLIYLIRLYKLRADTYRQMYIQAQKTISELHDYYLNTP